MTDITVLPDAPAAEPGADTVSELIAALESAGGADHAEAARQFSRGFIGDLARHLPLPQITVVLSAERRREQGLSSARGGELALGAKLIDEARGQFEGAALDCPALLAAETFQTAAEAYLAYVRGDRAGAEQLLLRSIDQSTVLARDFGYAMDFRRVHLGRNVLRLARKDADAGRVFDQHVLLLRYLDGAAHAWPLSNALTERHGAATPPSQIDCAVDEILTNLPPVLAALGDAAADRMRTGLAGARLNGLGETLALWCAAMAASNAGAGKAVGTGRRFLAAGGGRLPMARRCLVQALSA